MKPLPFSRLSIRTASYAMLILAILCQLATVVITWPLWQIRHAPVNLPISPTLPAISFGWGIVASLGLATIWPRIGVVIHAVVLLVACLFDQYRLEPQFIGLAILMLGCADAQWMRICRWYLVAMWLWTGVHKFLSADWMGHTCWSLVSRAGFDPEPFYLPFALGVAATEVSLGLLAWFRPRWASYAVAPVHLGIVVFLSPWMAGMNYSVIPWNVALAIVGGWVLHQQCAESKSISDQTNGISRLEKFVRVALILTPLGFYVGWVDRSLAHVMYSGGVPRGIITTRDGVRKVQGWDELAVPFPHERRLFRQYFALTAARGDKMHVSDPRRMLSDQFFVMRGLGPVEIDVDEFFRSRDDEVAGVAYERRASLFALSRAGVRMLRESPDSSVYAVAFTPENFDRSLLGHLDGLPNLRQLQFSGTDIEDRDLAELKSLRLLTGLGLNHTNVTEAGLSQLDDLPYLQYVETEGTAITKRGQE